MADIPSELSTGIVHGRFLFAVIDSDDTSQEPDAVPASGTVKFKASVPYLPVGSTADGPVTVINTVFTGVLDHEGFLCTPYPLSTAPMHRGVRLIATDDPSAAVQDWTWAAEYQFDPVEGAKAGIPSHSFALPSGSAVDLTTLVSVPSSPGYGLPQAEAAINETIVSALVVGDDLQLTRRNGETFIAGNVRGDKGDKGDKGDPGDGIPAGGAALQIIRRNAGNTTTEWITLDRSHVGLTNVDNTSDADKPVSTAVASALQGKADITELEAVAPENGVRAVGKGELVVNVRDYGAVGDGVADDTAAIQAAVDSLGSGAAFGGGTVLFDNGSYNVSSTIQINKHGVHLRGTGGFTAILRAVEGLTGPLVHYAIPDAIIRGVRISDLRFYMRNIEATAFRVEGGYDNCMFENIYADGSGGAANVIEIVPPSGGSISVGQTMTFVNVWAEGSKNPATVHTGAAWKIDHTQEANFIGCKGFGGSENSGTAWEISNSRGIQLYGCSFARALNGLVVDASARDTIGITIDGVTIEGASNSITTRGTFRVASMKVSGIRAQVMDLVSAGPISLTSTDSSVIDSGNIQVVINAGCNNNSVTTSDFSKVTDSGSNSTVIARASANGAMSMPAFNARGRVRYMGPGADTWEHAFESGNLVSKFRGSSGIVDALTIRSSPSDGFTSVMLTVNRAGSVTTAPVSYGAPDSGGTGFRVLRIPN